MKYLLNHWQGGHSLARAFWINSILFIVIFLFILELLSKINNPANIITYARLYLLLMIVTYVAILPWQIVGTVRTLIRHTKDRKKVIFSLFIIIFILLELTAFSRMLFLSQQKLIDGVYLSVSSYAKGGYEVSVEENTVLLSGKFTYGISKDFEQVLEENPQTKIIIFDSPGGLEYEARNVSSIIKERGLNTYVPKYCVSACVSAFIGGKKRQISSKALLGFHRGSSALYKNEYTKDEIKDRLYDTIKFYKQQGIDKEFVKRFYRTPPDELWYPRIQELLKQGVVTEILDE
ncbi:hypothetical protein N8384_03045 [Candidatus Thioglobus sp.]|nr:hypothetical protein [Candidatus Thioglobus sp.]